MPVPDYSDPGTMEGVGDLLQCSNTTSTSLESEISMLQYVPQLGPPKHCNTDHIHKQLAHPSTDDHQSTCQSLPGAGDELVPIMSKVEHCLQPPFTVSNPITDAHITTSSKSKVGWCGSLPELDCQQCPHGILPIVVLVHVIDSPA